MSYKYLLKIPTWLYYVHNVSAYFGLLFIVLTAGLDFGIVWNIFSVQKIGNILKVQPAICVDFNTFLNRYYTRPIEQDFEAF